MQALEQALKIINQLNDFRIFNKMNYYKPYDYQLKFHNAEGYLKPGWPAEQRALQAANGVGKTYCGAVEMAFHLTGRYPDWWQGKRYLGPVEALACGKTNLSVKDVVQKELFGDPLDDAKLGSGAIPKDAIVLDKITRKAGVPNAIQEALIRHKNGGHSRISLMAYEQKAKAFMGTRYDVTWADEEPPQDIWSQLIRGTFSRKHAIVYLTYTPEEGMTEVVTQFMNDIKKGQAFITATWDDAPHMTDEEKETRLQTVPLHEREMRTKGIPLAGAGLVFPVMDDDIMIDPIPLPKHWPRICGIDFGWDHPFAAVWVSYDRDTDTVYIYDEYFESKATPPIHASAIKARGEWIPIVWPHDGLNTEKGSGEALADQYRIQGLNLMRDKFSNPPEIGKEEGTGGNSVEAGCIDMLTRMQTGRLKVFSTCRKWFEEKRMYHRDRAGTQYKIISIRDDVISASRYACMSLRHAITEVVKTQSVKSRSVGYRNW
jgi:phage terminase large subunit-like protein